MKLKTQHDSYTMLPLTKLLVKEEKKQYIRHDQLFKHIIHTYFEEFLELFFPEVHGTIDFNSITPLSEEVFTDLFEGEYRRADIVIEAKIKEQNQFHNYNKRQFTPAYS